MTPMTDKENMNEEVTETILSLCCVDTDLDLPFIQVFQSAQELSKTSVISVCYFISSLCTISRCKH